MVKTPKAKEFDTIKQAVIYSIENDVIVRFKDGHVQFLNGDLWMIWDWSYEGSQTGFAGKDDIVIDLSKWQ